MADDAGFAVALTIREHLINDALLLAYAGTGFPRSLQLDVPDGPPDASIDVYLAPSQVTCNEDNSLGLAVRLWGSLNITVGGTDVERTIDGRITVRVKPRFRVAGNNLVLNPDSDDVTVTLWSFTVIAGGSFPPDVDLYLHGGLFQNRLQTAVRLAIAAGLVPAVDLSFLSGLIAAVAARAQPPQFPGLTVDATVKAGVLLIGLKVELPDLTIVGDPDLLFDIARGNDIAAATNAAAVPLVLADVAAKVSDAVAKEGATLIPPLLLTSEAGQFRIAAAASNSDGTAHFSFALVPSMFHTTPGVSFQYLEKPLHVNARSYKALGFTPADIHVDVSKSFWNNVIEVVGGIFTLGVLAVYIEDMVDFMADQFRSTIAHADTGPVAPRVRRSKPQPNGAVVRIEITAYDITTAGTYIGLTVRPEVPPAALIGPTTIPADLRAQQLRYLIRLPIEVHAEDPQLRIRWTVFDPTSGNLLVTEDDVALGRTFFDIVPESIGPGLTTLGIACRVYRVLGPEITDLVNEGVNLTVREPLPPGAYKRWWYDVKNPQVQYDATNDQFVYAGEAVQHRHSNWHRTDKPCKNAAKSSRYSYLDEVLDTLPFHVRDIALHRAELCDYCFYGGPAGIRPAL